MEDSHQQHANDMTSQFAGIWPGWRVHLRGFGQDLENSKTIVEQSFLREHIDFLELKSQGRTVTDKDSTILDACGLAAMAATSGTRPRNSSLHLCVHIVPLLLNCFVQTF